MANQSLSVHEPNSVALEVLKKSPDISKAHAVKLLVKTKPHRSLQNEPHFRSILRSLFRRGTFCWYIMRPPPLCLPKKENCQRRGLFSPPSEKSDLGKGPETWLILSPPKHNWQNGQMWDKIALLPNSTVIIWQIKRAENREKCPDMFTCIFTYVSLTHCFAGESGYHHVGFCQAGFSAAVTTVRAPFTLNVYVSDISVMPLAISLRLIAPKSLQKWINYLNFSFYLITAGHETNCI